MIAFPRAWAGALTLALLVPAAAGAQTRRNPFAELFGRQPERTNREFTKIDFRSTVGAQTAQTLEKDFDEANGDIPEGISGGADAAVSLEHYRDRFQATGHGRYAYQEYRREPAFGAPAWDGGGQVMVKATNRLSFDAGGRYMRSPFFHLMQLTPIASAQIVTPGDPFAAQLIDNDSAEATAGFSAEVSRRTSVSASAMWRETRFDDQPDNNFAARGFRGQWKRNMSRNLAARLGYGREEVRQRRLGDSKFVNELIDIGVDYSKSLTMARRTTLAFATETAVLRENGGKRRYRLNGGLDLQHAFLRSWRAGLGAHRATEFLPGFDQPLFSDRVRASLSGYVAPRLIFYANLDGGQGQIGFADTGKFFTYAGDARLTVALNRHVGFFTQYVYYHYQLPPSADSAVLLPRLSRQAVSVGIQAWVPLVNKEKVTRDPR